MTTPALQRVAIAMADGDTGQALLRELAGVVDVVAPAITGFSLTDAIAALANVEVVILVADAANPSARLVQGTKEDLTLLRIDTLSRAAAAVKAQRLVLVLSPTDDRAELEAVARTSGLPVTVVQGAATEVGAAIRIALNLPPTTVGSSELLKLGDVKHLSVCSVQKMAAPESLTAERAVAAYFIWLATLAPWLIRIEQRPQRFTIKLWFIRLIKLVVTDTTPDSCTLRIDGGLLAKDDGGLGRFEFRIVKPAKALITALFFEPRLPFSLYRLTQAVVHGWVMRAFGRSVGAA